MVLLKHLNRLKKIGYACIACVCLSLSIYSMEEGHLVLELVTRHTHHHDHKLICILALLNKTCNALVLSKASHYRAILKPHADTDRTALEYPDQRYVIWHKYGTACGFIGSQKQTIRVVDRDVVYNTYKQYTVDLCCLHINANNALTRFAHTIFTHAECEPQWREHNNPTIYEFYTLFGRGMTHITRPFLNDDGDPCVYAHEHGKEIVEHRITSTGELKSRNCYFNYADKNYSLIGPFFNDYWLELIKSQKMEATDKEIIFFVSGASMTQEKLEKIKRMTNGGTK